MFLRRTQFKSIFLLSTGFCQNECAIKGLSTFCFYEIMYWKPTEEKLICKKTSLPPFFGYCA